MSGAAAVAGGVDGGDVVDSLAGEVGGHGGDVASLDAQIILKNKIEKISLILHNNR